MTLIVTVNGSKTIWLLADRRLTRRGRSPQDDARKLLLLDATDGIAMLGYAGLGATALGTEPADWMRAVLRGRHLPVEQSLGFLATQVQEQLPRHMTDLLGTRIPQHLILAPAFVGGRVRIYAISLSFPPDRPEGRVSFDCWGASDRPPPLAIIGSGAKHLGKDKRWQRDILRLLKASDRGQITPHVVADRLATLNYEAHGADPLVGPRCIVVWRHHNGRIHFGGDHLCYTGTVRESDSARLPIADKIDITTYIRALADPDDREEIGRLMHEKLR